MCGTQSLLAVKGILNPTRDDCFLASVASSAVCLGFLDDGLTYALYKASYAIT